MNGQVAMPGVSETMYERMVRLGVDMGWYNRARSKRISGSNSKNVPLIDDACSGLSIYLLKDNGTLWTTQRSGDPYVQVRDTGKNQARSTYLCMHCKKQFKTAQQAHKHYEKE